MELPQEPTKLQTVVGACYRDEKGWCCSAERTTKGQRYISLSGCWVRFGMAQTRRIIVNGLRVGALGNLRSETTRTRNVIRTSVLDGYESKGGLALQGRNCKFARVVLDGKSLLQVLYGRG